MNNSRFLIFAILLCLFSFSVTAQETSQNEKIQRVLKERKRLINNGNIKNYFVIQVFSGDIANAKKVLSVCRTQFSDYSQIFYETPNYKVQVGKYRNRLDADSALHIISKNYPSAFVFKPKEKK